MAELKENPQVQRSKKWIIDALLQLMNEKKFYDITITEVCAKAGVVRRTFYRYYKTKESVLNGHITMLYNKYLGEYASDPAQNKYSVTYNYFKFWLEQKEFLDLLSKHRLLYFIMQNHDEFIPYINEKFFSILKDNYSAQDVEYYCLFVSGGLWRVLLKWVEDGAKETPDEMSKKVRSMLSFKLMSRLREEDTSNSNK